MSTPSQTSSSRSPIRVLITGGTGFIGEHIVQQLLSDPSIVITTISRNPPPNQAPNTPRHSHRAADITSISQIRAIFDSVKPHAVIHTASPHHLEPVALLSRTIVDGTKILLQLSQTCPDTKAFIYTSSVTAVHPSQTPLKEEDAILYTLSHPTTPYGTSKALSDALVLSSNTPTLHTAVLRLPIVYGENDNNTGSIPQLVSGLRKNQHKMQVGKNRRLFEFCYVQKAAEAHILALHALLDAKDGRNVAGEAFNISDGEPQGFFDFARKCYAAAGSPVAEKDVTVIPLGLMKAMASVGEWAYWIFTLGTKTPKVRREGIDYLDKGSCFSIEKAKERLGYVPVEDQDEAIKRSMDWAMANL